MEFVCRLGRGSGQVVSQIESAANEAELRQRLEGQGFYIFSLRARGKLAGGLTRSGRPRRIKPDDFLIFNQQFLTLSKSGLPLQKSLELLARQAKSEELRTALELVRDEVRSGALLSHAFESTGQFPKVYSATVAAGERSGSLDRTLAQYVTYQKISRGFRKKIVSALIYPAVLVSFLILLVAFVVGFVVPRFAMLYNDLGVELPAITRYVIELSNGFHRYAIVLLAVVVGMFIAARAAWASATVRLALDRLKFQLPVAGKLLLKFSVAEFARTLATLLQGGMPVVTALDVARSSIASPLVSGAISKAREEVTGGRSLSGSLRMSGLFPDTAMDMLEVGEATGALPSMLESLAEFYEEDVNIDLGTLVSLIDPIMLAAIAVIVAFVLIAFYLPLFSVAAQIH